ncbi:MAG: CPBP family intramembrane metalloprotease [Planctomycetota bacterium]|nr:CPBP family intramembrane metalloprotease [Planctomycetota bacterium]
MSKDPSEGAPAKAEDPEEVHGAGLRGLIRDLLGFDRAALAILVMVPIAMTLLDYYGMPWHWPEQRVRRPMHAYGEMRPTPAPLAHVVADIPMPGPEPVKHYVWWGICCLVFLVGLPMLTAWIFAKKTPRDLGLRLKGTGKDAKTYLLLYLMFLPVIYLVSRDPAFKETYPFYKPDPRKPLGADFLIFEIVYCSQFFAVEFFFRGFMVLGLKRAIGWASVLVMLAPYCMIHYYKPMPEAMGAIGAGLVLGALSWRTGTILYGWALHFGVALSMDLLALQASGRL